MTSFGLSTIGQVVLTVRDAPLAAEFYSEKLGVPLAVQTTKAAFFDCGEVRLMLTQSELEDPAVYFQVEDIDHAVQTLKSRGVAFEREPHLVAKMPAHDLWMAFFRDPDGNKLALMARKADPSFHSG